jgi:tetratricopeptide (TPR) repeat protein
MPSHTFTRLGYWQDSIETNELSAAAARKAGAVGEELHARDYQTYAYLQSGQDAAARRIVESLPEILSRRVNVTASAAPPPAGPFAVAAIPARYALERGAWADAARLEPRVTPFAYADAMTWFARALGAARMGDVAAAQAAVGELQKSIDKTTESKETYWIEQVTIQKVAATAWLALAEGRNADAVAAMREAADREDRTEKSAISPGPLAPARELLGEMFLELKQPKEALAAFQKTMVKEPNRFRALAGATRAASEAGDRAAARKYALELLAVCKSGDAPGRPELQAARRLAGTPRVPRAKGSGRGQ